MTHPAFTWDGLRGRALSPTECPCETKGEMCCLAFSGEEFPEPGTAQRLRAQGHELDVDGPSYLVHLYEDDPSFPAGLNGRFHGLLADRNRGTAVLFNDRYGMHRLYYHQSKDAFYFAAEAKAIWQYVLNLGGLDPRGLGEFVSCGAVLENRTLFEGIHVLPPASAVDFSQRRTRTENQLFPSEGVGRPRRTRFRVLLWATPGGFHAKPPALFRGA